MKSLGTTSECSSFHSITKFFFISWDASTLLFVISTKFGTITMPDGAVLSVPVVVSITVLFGSVVRPRRSRNTVSASIIPIAARARSTMMTVSTTTLVLDLSGLPLTGSLTGAVGAGEGGVSSKYELALAATAVGEAESSALSSSTVRVLSSGEI